MRGHKIIECRRIIALEQGVTSRQQVACQYCKKIGHNAENCEIIKSLLRKQGKLRLYCKRGGHTIDEYYKLKNKQKNYSTLPGGND